MNKKSLSNMSMFLNKQNICKEKGSLLKEEKRTTENARETFINSIKYEENREEIRVKNIILAKGLMDSSINIENLTDKEINNMIIYFKEYIKKLSMQLK